MIDTVHLEYTPVGSAVDLIYATDRELLIEGPAGSGKTIAMLWKAHLYALKFPGIRILLVRKVGTDLTTGALDTYHKHIRPDLVGVKTYGGSKFLPAQYKYPNGSVLIPAGMDKSDKVMSSEYDLILVNEVTNGITLKDWQDLTTRLRNYRMPIQQIVGDCNPAYARHWANLRCNAGLTRRIRSTHKDNPYYWDAEANDWTPIGREYVENTLGSLTGFQRLRLLEGKWASADGLVYAAFNPETMIQRRDVVELAGWRRILSADIGGRNPTAIGRIHVSGDERVHVSRCLYRRGMDAIQIIQAIKDECDSFGPETVYIDPSAKLIIDALVNDGYPAEPANNAVEDGIRQVQSVLNHGFSIDPDCVEMIDEFNEYVYPSNAKVESDKPIKDHDHAMDMLRYAIVGATEPVFDLAGYYATYAKAS